MECTFELHDFLYYGSQYRKCINNTKTVQEVLLILLDDGKLDPDSSMIDTIIYIANLYINENDDTIFKVIDKLVPILDYNIDKLLIEISDKLPNNIKSQKILSYILNKTNADIRYSRCKCISTAIYKRKMLLITTYINHLRNYNFSIDEKIRILSMLIDVTTNLYKIINKYDFEEEIKYLNNNLQFYKSTNNKVKPSI